MAISVGSITISDVTDGTSNAVVKVYTKSDAAPTTSPNDTSRYTYSSGQLRFQGSASIGVQEIVQMTTNNPSLEFFLQYSITAQEWAQAQQILLTQELTQMLSPRVHLRMVVLLSCLDWMYL